MTGRCLLFSPFRLDLAGGCLSRGGTRVELTPKAFAVLCHLAERPGLLIAKEELLAAVWPATFVGEGVLKVAVGEIRKALGDESRAPRFIETAHRRGYRFICPVEVEESSLGPVTAAPHPPAASPAPSVGSRTATATAPALSAAAPALNVRYAQSGEVNIAYQVVGDGPIDLVFVMGWVSHLEHFWTEPSFARFLRRLASFSRLILFDKRGTGLSDRVPPSELPTLEQRMDDLRAVLDAVGSRRAALCGVSEGGPMSALFAATYPEKCAALVMIGTYAKRVRDDGYPWAPPVHDRERFCQELQEQWGGPVGLEERAPSMAAEPAFREWWATYLRSGASPAAAIALTRMNAEIDVRHVLGSVRVPTLVLHRTGDRCLDIAEGRYVADRIPNARFVELPGDDHLPFVGDQDGLLDEVEAFVGGVRRVPEHDRVLATVLFAEFGDEPGDRRPDHWPELAAQVRRELDWFRGREIDGSRDGPLATFDGPARAVRCACTLLQRAARLGVRMRAGLHTGECDLVGGCVGGLAVELAAGVLEHAAMGEVLVSSTVRDLVAGSGIDFGPRGALASAAMGAEWRLYGVVSEAW